MKTCKYCGKPILVSMSGLRDFCSQTCKVNYLRKIKRDWIKKQRSVEKNNSYNNINCQNVEKSKQVKSTLSESQKQGLETKEELSQEELKITKSCCNYETKQKVGYCITLYEPYYTFKVPCRNCKLFQALEQQHWKRTEKKLKLPQNAYIVET